MKTGRRVAVHELLLPDGNTISMAVVELSNGVVMDYKSFDGELPMTEWLGGTLALRVDSDGYLRAYRGEQPLL